MVNEFKNILLAGIGAAAETYDKASKTVDELVKKGKITIDEGKELSEELKRNINEKVEKKKEERPVTKQDLADLFKEMNFASKDDIADLKNRIEKLEENKEQNQ
jgi:polyhydroxyalkanoate synthesis regulator phasin